MYKFILKFNLKYYQHVRELHKVTQLTETKEKNSWPSYLPYMQVYKCLMLVYKHMSNKKLYRRGILTGGENYRGGEKLSGKSHWRGKEWREIKISGRGTEGGKKRAGKKRRGRGI